MTPELKILLVTLVCAAVIVVTLFIVGMKNKLK